MATENPLRIPPYSDAAPFASSTPNVAMEDMGLPRNGQRFHGKGRDVVPNRSGSAPPTMESSLLAINNLLFQHNPSIGNISGTVQNSEPAMQSYLAFSDSKVNLNFRVHTPPSYGEKQRRGLISVDDCSLYVSQATLSTHHEEFEDDQSPHQPSDDLADHRLPPEENASPTVGSGTSDESVDPNIEALHATSISTDRGGILSSSNPSTSSNSRSLPLKFTRKTQPMQSLPKGNQSSKDVDVIESAMRDLSIPSLSNEQWYQQGQHNGLEKMLQHQVVQQQGNTLQAQSSKPHMGAQGLSSANTGMYQYIHGPEKTPGEAQPILQSSGFTPPLHASTAAYMTSSNPFYSSLQPSRLYTPQYGVGGYAINSSLVPPFMAGYPPHGAIPMVLDGVSGPNFNIRVPGVYTGGIVLQGTDLQHLNKFYGQFGYPMQPQLTDPSYMQYYQQPYGHIYNSSGQLDPLASGGGVVGSQSSVPETKKVPGGAGLGDLKLHHPITGANMPYQGRGGLISPHYFTGPSNMGVMMQYASTSLASPVLIGSPASGTGSSGGRDDMKFTVGDGRYGAPYPGWQGQRGSENFSDSKVCNFLVELKAGKGRRFELSDIAGNIVEFSADQYGSRFIQQKLETCSAEDKESVFKEVLPFAPKLMTDVFGNYVLQKFFEYGTPEQKKELANQLTGQIFPLSLQMYGCRVIQKALEVIELDQKVQLVRELDGHVLRCVRDQNGNHVIQKCIESIPTDKISFIISAFRGHIAELSMHPYGCRVIQRVLEHCTDEIQCQFIVNEIMDSVCVLAEDQYGNYVAQHVLERGTSEERSQIVSKLSGHIVKFSQHKFASNVVEKCVEFGSTSDRGIILEEILAQNGGNDNLFKLQPIAGNWSSWKNSKLRGSVGYLGQVQIMMKDQFANYVVQKILDTCTETRRTLLLNRIKTHVPALKKYTYGKHIVARVEAQFEEDNEDKVQT